MKLSAPIYKLKRKAKLLSRSDDMPLHQALDRIANEEGFSAWSLLASKASAASTAERLYRFLEPGDMLLLGARPGQGKTLMGIALAVEAMKSGHRSSFFTLEYTDQQVLDRFRAIGVDRALFGASLAIDSSDAICSSYVADIMSAAPRGTLIVIDYLQLLDHRRDRPSLMEQVLDLRAHARSSGHIVVCISQVDRSYDPSVKALPDLGDVRLPNPLDLSLFDKTCFLNQGQAQFRLAG